MKETDKTILSDAVMRTLLYETHRRQAIRLGRLEMQRMGDNCAAAHMRCSPDKVQNRCPIMPSKMSAATLLRYKQGR